MNQTQKTDTVDQNPVLRITRTFNAPLERVYQAFIEPGDLEKWFGPEGVNCVDHEIDPRPGENIVSPCTTKMERNIPFPVSFRK